MPKQPQVDLRFCPIDESYMQIIRKEDGSKWWRCNNCGHEELIEANAGNLMASELQQQQTAQWIYAQLQHHHLKNIQISNPPIPYDFALILHEYYKVQGVDIHYLDELTLSDRASSGVFFVTVSEVDATGILRFFANDPVTWLKTGKFGFYYKIPEATMERYCKDDPDYLLVHFSITFFTSPVSSLLLGDDLWHSFKNTANDLNGTYLLFHVSEIDTMTIDQLSHYVGPFNVSDPTQRYDVLKLDRVYFFDKMPNNAREYRKLSYEKGGFCYLSTTLRSVMDLIASRGNVNEL